MQLSTVPVLISLEATEVDSVSVALSRHKGGMHCCMPAMRCLNTVWS